VLKFSTNPEDYLPVVLSRWEGWDCYNLKPLIYAYEQENIAITGKGILDGQASSDNWWPWKSKKEYGWKEGMVSQEWNGDKEAGRNRLARMEAEEIPVEERIMSIEDRLRPPFFQPYLCKNVLVEGITINRSPFWLLHPLLCENVIIRGVTMDSHGPNNDGCDPESCKNVLIEDCYFNTGDDCIAIKSGRNKDGFRWNTPSENIIIRRCVMKDGHGGVVIGSEISGGCRNVWAEDCEMDSPNLDRIVRLKTNPLRGGTIENLFVRNIQVGECKESVMRMELKYERVTKGPNMPVIRNVILNNIQSNKSKYGVWIDGYTDHVSVHDILIRNCNFSNVEKGNLVIGAENVVFEEVFLNGKKVEDQP
jgi:polygalacturonase